MTPFPPYPGYDSMSRLLQYQRGILAAGGGSITTPISLPGTNQQQDYALDGLGNWSNTTITPEGGPPTVQNRIHNKLNELTQFATTPVLYDHGNNAGTAFPNRGNGNIVDDGTRLNAFDPLNRLAIVKRKSDGATIGQYAYDAIGRRFLKIVTNGGLSGAIANGTYRYISDAQRIVEELNGSNATTRQFIWGRYIDELIQMKTYVSTGSQPLAAGTYYLLSDLHYRSQTLTSTGAIVEAYDCDAYGITLMFSGPGADGLWFTNDDVASLQPACEAIFTGRQFDPETQVYNYRGRYYFPPLGRFVSRDPVGVAGGTNMYQYVSCRPLAATDPYGLKITIDSLPGASDVGEDWFHLAVLKAFQSVIGDCAVLKLVRGKNAKGEFDYSHIVFSQEKPGCKCDPCWQILKKALDLNSDKEIFIHKWRKNQKQYNERDEQGTLGIGTNTPRVYVHPSEPEYVFEEQSDGGETAVSAAMPFSVLVWHEAIGHGWSGKEHPDFDHDRFTRAGWEQYPGDPFSPGNRAEWEEDDPPSRYENMARDCLGIKLRAFYYTYRGFGGPSAANITIRKKGS